VERRPSVLVVDDDPSIRLLCRVNLELDGIGVREAASVSEARGQLDGGGLDVVLLDVHVGTESGLDLLRDIRRDHPRLKVALLTGSEGTDVRGSDPDAVIGKPFTLDDLRQTVERLAADG